MEMEMQGFNFDVTAPIEERTSKTIFLDNYFFFQSSLLHFL